MFKGLALFVALFAAAGGVDAGWKVDTHGFVGYNPTDKYKYAFEYMTVVDGEEQWNYAGTGEYYLDGWFPDDGEGYGIWVCETKIYNFPGANELSKVRYIRFVQRGGTGSWIQEPEEYLPVWVPVP